MRHAVLMRSPTSTREPGPAPPGGRRPRAPAPGPDTRMAMPMTPPGACQDAGKVRPGRLLLFGHQRGDRVDFRGRESDLGRGEVFFEVNDARGPRDGKHPRRAVQLPCERDLLRGP